MINSYKKPEILAPCGSYDILIAAINAGADACYFGGNKFGARAYATNFDLQTSLKAIDYAHVHGTSLYLTVNTLFKDNEINDLYDYLLPYYEAGLDAVIVQDLGVFKWVKEFFPDMPIHCSTQMNITSKYAAMGMKELGASRIVTAREMSLAEISEIKDEMDIEIESFVHGAMCYSYSGRCLMSSLAGGRSGNRGRCAQPCRKCYDGQYILSMKDMCTLTDVPRLIDAGIDSLKIEGRMKNEYYVASAVDAYNQIAQDYCDGCYSETKANELKFKLANIYNRGGFCKGYYYMSGGPEMISKDRPNNNGVELGKVTFAKNGLIGLKLYTDLYKQDVIELMTIDGEVIEITSGVEGKKNSEVSLKCPKTRLIKLGEVALRTRCNEIISSIEENIIKAIPQYDIYGDFYGHIGEKMSFTLGKNVGDKYFEVTVYGNEIEEATGKKIDPKDVESKLSQLGNTFYNLVQLKLDVDDDAFIPASAIKNIRRAAISALEEKICNNYKRHAHAGYFVDEARKITNNNSSIDKTKIHVGVTTIEQLREVAEYCFIDCIYLNSMLYKGGLKDGIIDKLKLSGVKLYLELPTVIKNSFDLALYLPNGHIDGIYIRSIDGLFAYLDYLGINHDKAYSLQIVCGEGVYAYNSYARELLKKLIPNVLFELPRELNKKELYSLEGDNNQLICYEHQPVMVSAQCVVKNKLGCNKSNSIIKIRDDKNNTFYARAVCQECCNIIYNGVPYMILDQVDFKFLNDIGVDTLKINFTIENKKQVKEVLDYVINFIDEHNSSDIFKNSKYKFTSGHFNRGVE
ncbi:MAG: U32 family peptidase [Lachnospiraceae bacterium]|nr:U32 family peptidase [Lachnospiraceae bacterium]